MKHPFDNIHDQEVRAELVENRELLKLLFPTLSLENLRVVDIGCGRGGWALAFAERGARVTGADPSCGSLLTAASYSPNIPWVACDCQNLPLRSGCADLVFLWGSIHYTENPELALEEIFRISAPHGEVLICAYAKTLLTDLDATIRWLVQHLPAKTHDTLLAISISLLQKIGGLLGLKSLKGSHSIRQKLAERWFYHGTLHRLYPQDLLEKALACGWKGESVALDFPQRFNPSNSLLLRFNKKSQG